MKTMQSPHACVLAFCLSALLCSPNEIMASPDTPQRAGEVSRVIPAVSIARGGKSISASAKTVVDWQDVVSTQASASRAGRWVGAERGLRLVDQSGKARWRGAADGTGIDIRKNSLAGAENHEAGWKI